MTCHTIAFLITVPLAAQWLKQPTVEIPRKADGKPDLTAPMPEGPAGKPDLSGMWRINPGSRAANIALGLKPEEIEPWAAAIHKQNIENFSRNSSSTMCLPAGPIYSLAGSPDGIKIVQTRNLIVILYGDMAYRQIFLDGRELPKDPNPTWMGYSIGRWEGDTLVVETAGFNDRTWLDFEGHPHSEELQMTERFRRLDLGHMDLEVTFRDPKVYAKSLTVAAKMEAIFDTEMLEYVCAENEKDRPHLIGKESDNKTVEVPAAVLEAYVGEYVPEPFPGMPDVAPPSISVKLENGRLTVNLNQGFSTVLIPLSETTFAGFGGAVEFGKNDRGEVTHMLTRVVEGDFRANRKK